MAIIMPPSGAGVSAADNADATWDEILTGATHNITNSAGKRLREIAGSVILTGTSPNTAGTTNTIIRIELDSDASAVNNAYDPAVISIIAGTGVGQTRQIYEYVGATKLAYVSRDWVVVPDNTSEYVITHFGGDAHTNEGLVAGGANNTVTFNALSSAVNDFYNGQTVYISAGTGAGQARLIIDYDGGTKVATVSQNWITNPVNGSSMYVIFPYVGDSQEVPTADSAVNLIIRDVIGNKNDTVAGTSLVALSKQIVAAVSAPAATTGTFSYLDAGAEQTIFEITGSTRKFISGILLDLVNMTQNGTIKLYSEVDGSNYRELASYSFVVATDSDGVLIPLKVPVNRDFKITYTEAADEGAARAMPYSYILEG